MKKDLALIGGLFLLLVVLIIFGRGFSTLSQVGPVSVTSQNQSSKESTEVKIKTLTVTARIADKADERNEGLGDLDSLPLNEGLLFVFENEGLHTFYMKDMNFAIDIIWVSKDKKIVHIEENVAPEPGKSDEELTRYKPAGNALYVLEVNAGLSSLHDLNVGDPVDFTL